MAIQVPIATVPYFPARSTLGVPLARVPSLYGLLLLDTGDGLQPRGPVLGEQLKQRLCVLQSGGMVKGADLKDLGASVGIALAPER